MPLTEWTQKMNEKELIEKIRQLKLTDQLAEEICSVQPMPDELFQELLDASENPETLERDGYKPISRIGLLWVKE